MLRQSVVGRDRDASSTPAASAWSDGAILLSRQRLVLICDIVFSTVAVGLATDKSLDYEALAEIVTVHDAAASQLDALSRVVDPSKIDVECGLHNPKYDRGCVEVSLADPANNPVEDVEEAVGAERDEVERIENGRYGGLAEEQELWEDADGLEDNAECPEELFRAIVSSFVRTETGETGALLVPLTSLKVVLRQPSNKRQTNGLATRLPPKHQMANFHPYSFSLVRAKTRIMMKTM